MLLVAGLLCGSLALFAQPASAEVVKADADGFVTRDMAVVTADTKAVWLALISPAKWWKKEHTWSGDAANLMLRPQAGGCFCERIPEDPDSDEVTLEGSVEHMRVIQAFPEKVLRMRGGLGPLQSEAATGVLTIALGESEVDGAKTTTIVWEYVVGGYMRYKGPEIAKAVNAVMSQQLVSLANMLGRANTPQNSVEDEVAHEKPTEKSAGVDEANESEDRMASLEEAVEALKDEE
jgi:hypothetical protein